MSIFLVRDDRFTKIERQFANLEPQIRRNIHNHRIVGSDLQTSHWKMCIKAILAVSRDEDEDYCPKSLLDGIPTASTRWIIHLM